MGHENFRNKFMKFWNSLKLSLFWHIIDLFFLLVFLCRFSRLIFILSFESTLNILVCHISNFYQTVSRYSSSRYTIKQYFSSRFSFQLLFCHNYNISFFPLCSCWFSCAIFNFSFDKWMQYFSCLFCFSCFFAII